MELNLNIKRLECINKMIVGKQTGSPPVFAQKIGVSEATLYRYLRLMKILGAPIEYNPILQTYFYERKGNFMIRFCETESKKKRQLKKNR